MDKTKFVLIHGLLREARHWRLFPRFLRQQYPDSQIMTPDIPGNGCLNHLTSPDTVSNMTEVVRGQVTQRQNLKLIAISMGGMVAIDWMSRYPQEVAAAVLINTSARPLSPFYHRLRWTVYPQMIKSLFHSASQREADILALVSNKYGDDKAVLASWQLWQQQNPVSSISTRNQFLAAVKFSTDVKPQQPVLVIASRMDRLVNYRCSMKLSQAWHTGYVQHPAAGHDLPLDEPEWLAQVTKQWFDEQNCCDPRD